MYDLDAAAVIHRYVGHEQGRFTIRSCFGGANESFVASGSEGGPGKEGRVMRRVAWTGP